MYIDLKTNLSEDDLKALSVYALEHALDSMQNLESTYLLDNFRTSLIVIMQCIQEEYKKKDAKSYFIADYQMSTKTLEYIFTLDLNHKSTF